MKAPLNSHLVRLGIAGALVILTACSADTNLVRDAAVATGVGAEPKPAPDFVAGSRPAELDYIRPGLATRSGQAKTTDQVKAMETEMERTRTTNESKAAEARDLGARTGPGAPNP
jgi:hypothetical protein